MVTPPAATPAPPPKRIRAEQRTVTIGKRLRVCVYLPGGALAETTLTARLVRIVAAGGKP